MAVSSVSSSTSPSIYTLGNTSSTTSNSSSSSSSNSSGTSQLSLALSGLESGLNWQTLVTEIEQADRAPETTLQNQQTTIQSQVTALGTLISALKTVQSDVTALKQYALYDARSASVGDSSMLSASAYNGTNTGTYTINIGQLATASVQNGTTNIAGTLNSSNDVSSLVLANASFSQPITAGTITVNGKQITISTSETLQQVFDAISTATNGAVTGSYSATGTNADEITLSSSSPITLGSTTDTSNFLQVAQLYNGSKPSNTITSANKLGSVQLNATLANANLAVPITGNSSGNGSFSINGVTFNYNINSDTISGLLNEINSSNAGVIATYDNVNNRFILTNASTGNLGISLQDGANSNFLGATGISGGTLTAGTNLQYTINGGGQRVSYSNTIDPTNSGISGLTMTALNKGITTVQVQADTTALSSAITQLVTDYNSAQSAIATQTAITTDSSGTVTSAALASDPTAMNLGTQLRQALFGQLSGLNGTINQLSQLGFESNSTDNTLTQSDPTELANALSNNLSAVQDFFTNSTNGLATSLGKTLTSLVGNVFGATGSLVNEQNSLSKQSSNITGQINTIEQSVLAEGQRLTNEFVAMENAMAQVNSNQQFLTQALNAGTL
ncbi:MAG TPA: flagellar filament capping protein FliD [Verrucomicrobiae bacterium]|nr:flagellar filament capping protein FliD [Verrucomicrobiae bacterium]